MNNDVDTDLLGDFGGSPFGHPPYTKLMEGDAGLSEISGCGWDLFLYGESVGEAAGFVGAAYWRIARGGARNKTGPAVPYRCLGGAA